MNKGCSDLPASGAGSVELNRGPEADHAREVNSSLSLCGLTMNDIAAAAKPVDASDFKLMDNAPGVSVYGHGADYVVSVDLSGGAQLDIVAGDKLNTGSKSVYGGPDPSFHRMSSEQALQKERKIHPDAICVFNAEFFNDVNKASVPVAFPFKTNGTVESEGFATVDRHQGKRLTLQLADGYARIVPFRDNDISSFRNITAKEAVVSLNPSENIDGEKDRAVGRTYVGLSDPDKSGNYRHMFIFASSASTQQNAEDTLKQFGAGPIIMFDGGGSSQLLFSDHHYVDTTRAVPQFLSVIAAPHKS